MPVKQVRAKNARGPRAMKIVSSVRLSPYLRGVVYGMRLAGATLDDIHKAVRKPDGSSISQQSIFACIRLCEQNGGVRWDGNVANTSSSGRPRETTKAMERALMRLVFKNRGRAIVTVAFVQRMLPS